MTAEWVQHLRIDGLVTDEMNSDTYYNDERRGIGGKTKELRLTEENY